jgi:hypothetical protein
MSVTVFECTQHDSGVESLQSIAHRTLDAHAGVILNDVGRRRTCSRGSTRSCGGHEYDRRYDHMYHRCILVFSRSDGVGNEVVCVARPSMQE